MSSVLSELKKYHPSGNLKFNYVGIFQSSKLRILMEKILSISPKLNFTPNTLGCYGLMILILPTDQKLFRCQSLFESKPKQFLLSRAPVRSPHQRMRSVSRPRCSRPPPRCNCNRNPFNCLRKPTRIGFERTSSLTVGCLMSCRRPPYSPH